MGELYVHKRMDTQLEMGSSGAESKGNIGLPFCPSIECSQNKSEHPMEIKDQVSKMAIHPFANKSTQRVKSRR